jgi:hypothetical protein
LEVGETLAIGLNFDLLTQSYSAKLGLAVGAEEMDAVSDRTQMSNLITVSVLRRETQAGGAGDMTELHGN